MPFELSDLGFLRRLLILFEVLVRFLLFFFFFSAMRGVMRLCLPYMGGGCPSLISNVGPLAIFWSWLFEMSTVSLIVGGA